MSGGHGKEAGARLRSLRGAGMIGQLAVMLDLATPEQVCRAVEDQSRSNPREPLGQVLVRQGVLQPGQLEFLLGVQDETIRSREDAMLGRIGVLNRFYSDDDLRRALDEKRRRPSVPIGMLLREAGLITEQQLEAMLTAQRRMRDEEHRTPALEEKEIALDDRESFTIGRGPENDVVLRDPRLSRRHCRIHREGGGWFIEDLGSLLGVLIDGRAVVGREPLPPGRSILIGETLLTLEADAVKPALDPARPMRVRYRRRHPVRPRIPPALPIAAAVLLLAAIGIVLAVKSSDGAFDTRPEVTAAARADEEHRNPPPLQVEPRTPRRPAPEITNDIPPLPAPPAEEPIAEPEPIVLPDPPEDLSDADPAPDPAATEPAPSPPGPSAAPDVDALARAIARGPARTVGASADTLAAIDPAAAVAALVERRERAARRAGGDRLKAALMRMAEARRALFEARLGAILRIADVELYTEESGQPEIDRRVAEVRQVWQRTHSMGVARLSSSRQESLRDLDSTDALLGALGAEPRDSWELRWARALAAGPVTVDDFPLEFEPQDVARRNRDAMAHNERHHADAGPEGWELVRVLNEYRMMLGRHALRIDPALCRAARAHSEEMSSMGYFSHYSPVTEHASPATRARLHGFEGGGIGENILMGLTSGREAHDGWYHSAPHHRNMIRVSYTRVGVGTRDGYWTEILGTMEE